MVFSIHMIRRRSMKVMFTCFFFILLMSILFSCCLCIGSDSILAGQSLLPNQTIISKEGKFELGFFTPGKSNNYYVGIWYKNIPERTVVWVANRDRPIYHSFYNSSRLEMSKQVKLLLIVFLESIGITGTLNATEAVILDTGNFVMRNASGIILWQSFDHPTDTWLPGGGIIGFRGGLVSWKNPNDPGTGNYTLGTGWDESRLRVSIYGLNGTNSETYTVQNVYDTLGYNNSSYYFEVRVIATDVRPVAFVLVYNVINESIISRIVIDSVGLLTHFLWSEAAQAWTAIWVEPSDACKRYALCGPYAICDTSTAPVCSCVTGFVPRAVNDWDLFDFSGGCVREKPASCDGVEFRKVSNITSPAKTESLGAQNSAHICELTCEANCLCNAYAFSTEDGCSLFVGDFLDSYRPSNSFAGRDLYIRMDSKKGGIDVPRLALALPISAVVFICSVLLCYFWRKRKSKVSHGAHQNLLLLDLSSNGPKNHKRTAVGTDSSGEEKNNKYELPTFSFSSIAAATNNFSVTNKLGEGGFGPVYKGELLNRQLVAVKRLSRRSGQGLEEFKNETELIAKLQHRNLVGILGCCIENDEKILVYEYMPNKSLDFFLFEPIKKEVLEWGRRVCIIAGIAQGLAYLHHYSRLRIIHRDLKASNILLDAEMNPKFSDFGMARIFRGTDLQANTSRVVGTYGYMSPEYAMEGVFSIKSDVFAFGVLMLEIISGKKNTGFYGSEHLSLLGCAWNLWTNNRALELVDPASEILSSSSSSPLRYIQIGLLCVQENPGDRPTMSDVVAMLNNEQKAVASPKHPAFSVGRTFVRASRPGENKVELCSVNDLTVSVMEAR